MIKFSKDKVKLLHQLISEETGGTIKRLDPSFFTDFQGLMDPKSPKTRQFAVPNGHKSGWSIGLIV